jgi:hypothetical protein
MKKFCYVEAIRECVQQQMIRGARVALGFMHVHHPQIDLEVVESILPSPPGDGRVQMEEPYAAALGPTENIIWLVEAETNSILRQQAKRVE